MKWKDKYSVSFTVRNGVRQGNVLSPSLFNVYLDSLLDRLKDCGFGARIGYLYVGALAYADDVTLLSPTVGRMQKMLDVCSVFADESGLLFNSKKSTSCVFVKNRRSPVFNLELTLNGCILPLKSVVKHLGIVMDTFRLTSVSVEARVRKFWC